MPRVALSCVCALAFLAACDGPPSGKEGEDAGDPTPQCSNEGEACTTWDDCCGSNVYCDANKCKPRLALGEACTVNEACQSNVCDFNGECCNDAFTSTSSSCSTDGDCCFGEKCQSGDCCYRSGTPALSCLGGHDPTCCTGNCNDITGNCQ